MDYVITFDKKYYNMNTKFLIRDFENIEVGSFEDDINYLSLNGHFPNLNNSATIFQCSFDNGNKYYGKLIGNTEIVDYKGNLIDNANNYLDYIKNGKRNLIHINKTSGISIMKKNDGGGILNVFESIHDCLKYIKDIEKVN